MSPISNKYNTSWIIKVNFLILGLFVVVYLIWSINHRGLSPGFLTLFGIQPPPATTHQQEVTPERRAKILPNHQKDPPPTTQDGQEHN